MIRAFVEQLNSVGPHRMVDLAIKRQVSDYYVLVGPEREATIANRSTWDATDMLTSMFVPRWGWYVNTPDQAADLADIQKLDAELNPAGWCLDIEKHQEGQNLSTLIAGVHALGKPIVASLGGFYSASYANLDFRTLDKYGVACEYQAYFDSGEGPSPAEAVQELYSSSFIIPGWEYRARLGKVYSWGKITRIETDQRATFDSFKIPGGNDAYFAVGPRAWGNTVVSRTLQRSGQNVGTLMGRATYSKIRVALDVTRTAQNRPAVEWTPIAASARVAGSAKRGVSIYLLDNASDEVVQAIAEGAA